MAAHEHINPHQLSLFTPPKATPKEPGDMTPGEWFSRPDVAYHGTFRHDWAKAPVAHLGTIGQASSRVNFVGRRLRESPSAVDRYYSGESHEGEDVDYYAEQPTREAQEHEGRVYARRLANPIHEERMTDRGANAAEMGHRLDLGHEEWEVPGSVRESAQGHAPRIEFDEYSEGNVVWPEHADQAERGAAALGRGEILRYRNMGESNVIDDPLDKSHEMAYIAPKGSTTSWEQDVLSAPHSSELARNYARQRISQGKEGVVHFPEDKRQSDGVQEQLPLEGEGPSAYNWNKVGATRTGPRQSTTWHRHINSIQFTTGGE